MHLEDVIKNDSALAVGTNRRLGRDRKHLISSSGTDWRWTPSYRDLPDEAKYWKKAQGADPAGEAAWAWLLSFAWASAGMLMDALN